MLTLDPLPETYRWHFAPALSLHLAMKFGDDFLSSDFSDVTSWSRMSGPGAKRSRRWPSPNFPDEALSCATLTPFQIWASVLCPGSSEAAMVNPAAQAHCRCQSPHQSTAAERNTRGPSLPASIAWLLIAVSSTTSLECCMSNPPILLIHF